MARFHDLLAALTPEQTALLPEGIISELTTEYDNDLSIRDAAVTEREDRIAAANLTIAEKDKDAIALKAANYDLMLKAKPPTTDADDDESDDDSDDDDFFEN